MSTKHELVEKIKRRLGYPLVKVELTEDHYNDAISYAVSKFRKWAVGQATQEVFFTLMLSGGQYLYDLPVGVTEVISYETSSVTHGINTLFTIENYLYNQGYFEGILSTGDQFDFIAYHIALDFLATLDRYEVDAYNYKYHKAQNILEIQPPPPTGGSFNGYDSPGFILLRTYMIEGSTLPGWSESDIDDAVYDTTWILDYATALCKISLGTIRRKFASFSALGNIPGLALDGSELIAEGKEELTALGEALKTEEVYDGMTILMG